MSPAPSFEGRNTTRGGAPYEVANVTVIHTELPNGSVSVFNVTSPEASVPTTLAEPPVPAQLPVEIDGVEPVPF